MNHFQSLSQYQYETISIIFNLLINVFDNTAGLVAGIIFLDGSEINANPPNTTVGYNHIPLF